MVTLIAVAIFATGYAAITIERRLDIHKAITSFVIAGLLWLLISFKEGNVRDEMQYAGGEIFGFIMFLLSAMALVELLLHYGFFDWIRVKLLRFGFNDYKQLWVIAIIAFFSSAIIDNLTATLVMVHIATRFFRGSNLVVATCAIVVAANAGGAFSPIGDITTLMLWLSGKFSATEIIIQGFLPSLSILFVSTWLISRHITLDTLDIEEEKISLTRSEWIVIGLVLGSFFLPVVFSQIGTEPFLGLWLGFGIVVGVSKVFRIVEPAQTHLTVSLEKIHHGIELWSLAFFAGILLSVGALEHLGILERLSEVLLGPDPSFLRMVAGSAGLGIFSAVGDNIPLTAAAIDVLKTNNSSIWVLLALTVGTGGSMLAIGSAAGVVAMERVRELDFFRYIKIATIPALVGYIVAIGVWYLQYLLFFS